MKLQTRVDAGARVGGNVMVIVAVVAGLLALSGAAAYIFVFSGESAEVASTQLQEQSAAQNDVAKAEDIPADSQAAQGLAPAGPQLFRGYSSLYYRTETPAGELSVRGKPSAAKAAVAPAEGSASPVGVYRSLPGADPATFSEIGAVTAPNPHVESRVSQVTYYRDNDQVFAAHTTIDSLTGDAQTSVDEVEADPETFEILSDTYAKDAEHVFIVSWVCDGEECVLVLEVVEGADPDTFHVIPTDEYQQSDGTGTVTADAADSGHLYYEGEAVDTLYVPGSGATDMTPILISP